MTKVEITNKTGSIRITSDGGPWTAPLGMGYYTATYLNRALPASALRSRTSDYIPDQAITLGLEAVKFLGAGFEMKVLEAPAPINPDVVY